MSFLRSLKVKIFNFTEGVSSIEYAILVSLIAAVIVAVVAILGGVVFDFFDFSITK